MRRCNNGRSGGFLAIALGIGLLLAILLPYQAIVFVTAAAIVTLGILLLKG
ncbi:hypothetical protein [Solibaculum mannosilyticum]|uniref:hypothetical protein n=1 Tax=Solibaculum mannosilyticum TaxID=2780922 RepID=UPI0007A85DB6|nr:hypothetical protein [Solibaculum mannosilyticum]MCO7136452.1 hypothetical protein [[Clostridium] leptum]CZT57238.1 hypothetical protein BN3661_01870 [Eubacteriaceae bacterium CHKCI005]